MYGPGVSSRVCVALFYEPDIGEISTVPGSFLFRGPRMARSAPLCVVLFY